MTHGLSMDHGMDHGRLLFSYDPSPMSYYLTLPRFIQVIFFTVDRGRLTVDLPCSSRHRVFI